MELKVLRNKHYFRPIRIKMVSINDVFTRIFTFTKSTLTELAYSQLNKLTGFSTDPLMLNSIRVAFEANKGYIYLYSYIRINGIHVREYDKYIGKVLIDNEVQIKILRTDDNILYNITQNDTVFLCSIRLSISTFLFGFEHNPYYGGRYPAPNDMIIQRDDNTDKIQKYKRFLHKVLYFFKSLFKIK